MRRAWMIAAAVLVVGGLLAVAGAPLLPGVAMLSPGLVLGLVLWCGSYPGARQIERLQQRQRRPQPRAARMVADAWQRFRRPSPFCAPHGPLLGISLAVRPPPA